MQECGAIGQPSPIFRIIMVADSIAGEEPLGNLLVTPRDVPRQLPGSGVPGALVVAGTGVALFLTQWASVLLWVPPTRLTTVWLQGGLLLGIVLVVPSRLWPFVLISGGLGQALLFIVQGLVTVPSALLVSGVNAGATCILALGLRRVLPGGFPLTTVRDFLIYLLVVAIGGAVLVSTAFLGTAALAGFRDATFELWRTFALATVLAYVTVTPAVAYLVQDFPLIRRDPPTRYIEASILVLLLGASSGLVFTGTVSPQVAWPIFGITVPSLLLWAAVRFGTSGVSASLLLVTLISTLGTGRGLGPFTGQSPGINTLTLQLFMLATGLPFMGLSIVLTAQRRAAAALESTHGRLRQINRDLVQAREEESSRIARELHDDIGQHLALVSIGLSRLRGSIGDVGSGPEHDVRILQAQTGSIVRSLREISHRLHPSTLDHAGLLLTLQMTCDEVGRATGLPVTFEAEGDEGRLAPEVSLCLFRVTQEAIANAVRHSGAARISVHLGVADDGAELRVSDDGGGFVSRPHGHRSGLGLHSARERVAAVGGTLAVSSSPGAGTTLRVQIPFTPTLDA